MQTLRFDWDPKKNVINQNKHGIGFEEAKTCFEDDYAEIFEDAEHSREEERLILLGMSTLLKTLVVVYTERTLDETNEMVNRIISARKATRKEFQYYWSRRPKGR